LCRTDEAEPAHGRPPIRQTRRREGRAGWPERHHLWDGCHHTRRERQPTDAIFTTAGNFSYGGTRGRGSGFGRRPRNSWGLPANLTVEEASTPTGVNPMPHTLPNNGKIRTAVVTGGHSFQVPPFYEVFRSDS